MHKWNSNVPSLESKSAEGKQELTYAKQILSQDSNEIKIFGMFWNKEKDNISVVKPIPKEKRPTKRNILSELASVYNPIDLISSSHLIGKILYREVCELKIPWDEVVPLPIKQKWDKWKLDIETKVEIPRSNKSQLQWLITRMVTRIWRCKCLRVLCSSIYSSLPAIKC